MSKDEIRAVELIDGDVRITVLSIGCVVQSWQVAAVPVVLGYADVEDYRSNPFAMGMVVGRVVNRISHAVFNLEGRDYPLDANAGPHHIHGGSGGIGWRNWETEVLSSRSVCFRLLSAHGDQGYPGQVQFEVRMELQGHSLLYDMRATPDRVTPINMAQHHYFNLNGSGDIRDHRLCVAASRYTPTDAQALPLGSIDSVQGSAYDFRQPRTIADADPEKNGHDANLVLEPLAADTAAVELSASSGLGLKMWTDQPCVQLYTSGTLQAYGTAAAGAAHQRFGGICLEAQNYPDAMAHANFGSILCGPETPYRQQHRIEIAPQ